MKIYQKKFDWPQIGNDGLLEFLDRSLTSLKLAQTYIFSGPEDLGKSTLALAFARNLLLSDKSDLADFSAVNSDLHILSRETGKKNISIEAVRDFIKTLSLSSFLNSYKIGIIKEAQTLSDEAANALLKTLEEPREKVIIILLTTSVDLLPATITSRAQVLYFYPVSFDSVYDYLTSELNLKRGSAKEMAALAAGRPLLAAKFVQDEAFYESLLSSAKLFLSFLNSDISSRLQNLQSFLADHKPLTVNQTDDILESWQRITRDLILFALDCPDLIQHQALLVEIKKIDFSDKESALLYYANVLELLSTLKNYLGANVTPTNVLEQVIYNL